MYLGGEKVVVNDNKGGALYSGSVSWSAHGGSDPTTVAITLPKHEHNALFNQSEDGWKFAGPRGVGLPFEIGRHYAIEDVAMGAAP